jgi:hypothetical protein
MEHNGGSSDGAAALVEDSAGQLCDRGALWISRPAVREEGSNYESDQKTGTYLHQPPLSGLNSLADPNPSTRDRKYPNCGEGLTPGKFFVKPLIVRLYEYRLAAIFRARPLAVLVASVVIDVSERFLPHDILRAATKS